ncbi:hypothetical protein OG607_16635 [Streptomyces sp. NBC_01537]|uniref:WXG100 family type VII secretion target n=1 Tax=Streptomyces sp. NBC_01537 TaxID=2903896 RepID=UPI003867E3D7
MTAQQFRTDPDSLRSAGESFHDLGWDFSAAAARLKDTLDGLEKPWGEDDFGEIVSTVHDPIKQGMDESMPFLGSELTKIGESLKAMADNYQRSDVEAVTYMGTLNAQRPTL